MATSGISPRYTLTRLMALSVVGIISFLATVGGHVVDALRSIRRGVEVAFVRMVSAFKVDVNPIALRLPLIAFVRARAFVLRLAKRERPDVHPSWRMVPST